MGTCLVGNFVVALPVAESAGAEYFVVESSVVGKVEAGSFEGGSSEEGNLAEGNSVERRSEGNPVVGRPGVGSSLEGRSQANKPHVGDSPVDIYSQAHGLGEESHRNYRSRPTS